MKLIIVDDEPLIQIGIKSSIGWQGSGVEIVGEAADGEEALKLIEEKNPDVVLLDIKMPKKDGLEVLSEMKAKGMKAKVIVLSSFDDFAYVKNAMKLGAVDYFHKPSMSIEEILDVLNSLKEDIATDNGSEPQEPNAEQERDRLLHHLLTGKTDDARLTKLKEGNLYVIVFTVKQYYQVMKRYTKESPAFLPNTIQNLMNGLLSKENEIECVRMEENLYAVMVSYSRSKSVKESFSRVNDIVYMIHSSLKRFINIDSVFGISEAFHSFGNFSQAFRQAKQALEMKFYQPNDLVFYYRARNEDEEQKLEQIHDYVVTMKNGLKEEKYEMFAVNLEAWERYVEQHECLTERDVKKIYEGLHFMLQEGETYSGKNTDQQEIEDFVELSAYYHALFNEKLKAKLSSTNKEYNPLIRNIMQYIETNYQQSISLKILGDIFKASPNYISRLFKQEVDRGLFDYLNEIRIRRAKELLKDSNYKIYEIAEMVGFNSQVHFAIVFHKYVGMAPKEYRKEIG